MDNDFDVLFRTLPLEDLQEEYEKLYERYRQLREEVEADTQRIYELRRNLETATAAENYLSQELEQMALSLASVQESANANTKAQTELDELRRQHHILSTDYATLQQDYAAMEEENCDLRKRLEAATCASKQSIASAANGATDMSADRLSTLERENLELLQKLDEFQEESVQHTMALAERERNIEILTDQVTCLEENLRSKREDLDEKASLLESTQEQLAEANSQLALLTTKPDSVDRKGNSLFAEVDDQRQAMKNLLASQKKSYLEMKKVFNDSQTEIRRLKRENIAMHTELRECSSIFCTADKTYQDKLNERIRHLLCQVEGLEKQLNLTQERLKDLACDKGVVWLDSMMSFCKQETDDLKKQLHGVRIQKASLEEQLRNVKQDMARWRFESLKSRCVLLDRENLLNEHGIPFKAVTAMEFHINQRQLETARPRIVYASPGMKVKSETRVHTPTAERVVVKEELENETVSQLQTSTTQQIAPTVARCDTPVAEMNDEKENVTQQEQQNSESAPDEQNKIEMHKSTAAPIRSPLLEQLSQNKNGVSRQQQNDTTFPIKQEELAEKNENILVRTSPTALEQQVTENKFAKSSSGVETDALPTSKSDKKAPPAANALPGPSILCKKRETLAKEHGEKNVQFSAQAPTIHDISANVSMSQDITAFGGMSPCEGMIRGKAKIKQMRTKSNIIVRRVIVASKRENC